MKGKEKREMEKEDCVVIWGKNEDEKKVNVMKNEVRERKERGEKIVEIEVYENEKVRKEDMGIVLKKGKEGDFECEVMNVMLREGMEDRDYMKRYKEDKKGMEENIKKRKKKWEEKIKRM